MQLFIQAGDLGPKWFHVALRALVMMAQTNEITKSNVIAETLGEDPTTIRKILAKLIKAGIVKALGGRYGGYMLQKAPESISVNDVYLAFAAPPTPYDSVPSTGTELYISLMITKAEDQFQGTLRKHSLKDVLDNRI